MSVPKRWELLSRAALVDAAREEAIRLIASPGVIRSVDGGRYLSETAILRVAAEIQKAVKARIGELDADGVERAA